MRDETSGRHEDIIVITGTADCPGNGEGKRDYLDVLKGIYAVLSDPSHDVLEEEIMTDLSNVTAENAPMLSYKLMGINGVSIEARWHAAEAFTSKDNLLYSLAEASPGGPIKGKPPKNNWRTCSINGTLQTETMRPTGLAGRFGAVSMWGHRPGIFQKRSRSS